MDYYIPATISHYFYIFLSYFIPSLILFPTFHRPDRDNRHLKVAGIISAVFILFVFMLPKTISNSVCSFGVYFFWYANFSFLLEGTKSFKLTLALCFYCLPLFIEILCGVVVTFITLFFPSSNIVNAYSLIANNYFSIFFMAMFGIFWELVSIKPLKRFFLNYGYLMTNIKLTVALVLPLIIAVQASNILYLFVIPKTRIVFTLILCIPFSFLICIWLNYGFHMLKSCERQHLEQTYQLKVLEQEIAHIHQTNAQYEHLYRWNHDTANHLLALSFLIEQKNYQRALEYIQRLQQERETFES